MQLKPYLLHNQYPTFPFYIISLLLAFVIILYFDHAVIWKLYGTKFYVIKSIFMTIR